MRTSTVPKLWCGRTSHQSSRMVLMKPVSTRLLRSQTYSDQLRMSGGRPAVGRVSMILLRWECKPGVSPLPERAVGGKRQERRQVLKDAVADHDRLVAGIDSDMHVQTEGDDPPRGFLQQIDQVEVAIERRDDLVLPARKRMSAAPEEPHAMAAGDLADDPDFLGEIAMGIGDALANLGVDLDVALEKLGLDRTFQAGGQVVENLRHPAAKRHRLAVDQIELDLDADRRAARC